MCTDEFLELHGMSTDLGTPREFFLRGDHPNLLGAGRNQAAAETVPWFWVKKTRVISSEMLLFYGISCGEVWGNMRIEWNIYIYIHIHSCMCIYIYTRISILNYPTDNQTWLAAG